MSDWAPEDHPGRIYNPDSPYWHKIDFEQLQEEDFTNTVAFLCATIGGWLAKMGFSLTWFPPDPNLVCPLPAWMIADAYAAIDPEGRDADYWAGQMVQAAYEKFGPPSVPDDPDAALHQAYLEFEAFIRSRET